MSKSATIIPLGESPAVVEATRKLAGFRTRQGEASARRQALQDALGALKSQANIEALAEQMRRGEQVSFRSDEEAVAQRRRDAAECDALNTELAALAVAISLEEEALAEAKRAAEDAASKTAIKLLETIDREIAGPFLAFVLAREKRVALAVDLSKNGYPDLMLAVASNGLLPQIGSLSDPNSLVALLVKGLRDRGHLPKG